MTLTKHAQTQYLLPMIGKPAPQSNEHSEEKRGGKTEIGINTVKHVQSPLPAHWITDISNHYQNIMFLTGIQQQLLPFWSTFNLYIQN